MCSNGVMNVLWVYISDVLCVIACGCSRCMMCDECVLEWVVMRVRGGVRVRVWGSGRG